MWQRKEIQEVLLAEMNRADMRRILPSSIERVNVTYFEVFSIAAIRPTTFVAVSSWARRRWAADVAVESGPTDSPIIKET